LCIALSSKREPSIDVINFLIDIYIQ
jgi:hypothetical protein